MARAAATGRNVDGRPTNLSLATWGPDGEVRFIGDPDTEYADSPSMQGVVAAARVYAAAIARDEDTGLAITRAVYGATDAGAHQRIRELWKGLIGFAGKRANELRQEQQDTSTTTTPTVTNQGDQQR